MYQFHLACKQLTLCEQTNQKLDKLMHSLPVCNPMHILNNNGV